MADTETGVAHDSLYSRLYARVDRFREVGLEPDRIVVPGSDWRRVKERAEIKEGEGTAGGDKTLVNGVRATYRDHQSSARVVFEVIDP